MTTSSVFVFFSVFYGFVFKFVDSQCPERFPCEDLGELEFPLANYTQPYCGLFTVDCHARPFQKLYLDTQRLSPSYVIVKMLANNKVWIRSPMVADLLRSNSCTVFEQFSAPHSPFISFYSPSISFSFYPNITLFLCLESPKHHQDFPEHYRKYSGCNDFDIYYTNSNENLSAPYGCYPLRMPVKSGVEPEKTDLFTLLSPEYLIEWNLTGACIDCQKKGRSCPATGENEFRCGTGTLHAQPSKLKVLSIAGMIGAVFIFFIIVFTYRYRKNLKAETRIHKDIELFLENHESLAPRRYKYSDIKKMTDYFHDKLGEGGFASVYRGKLPDGRPLAVKILKEAKGNGEEFINEVASISRTSHVNIVALLGFCFEGSERALIYEFMPNGSLEKFIYNYSSLPKLQLGREKMFQIAVGIARGIEYLHQGCKTRILHFDIKPHNILLDKDFIPKISDFGLAKLCPNRSSIVSMLGARGTIGYIAPELVCRNIGDVSYKSDIYSYGMMVLEMTGQRKNADDGGIDTSSEKYFPEWIYKNLERNSELDLNSTMDAIESSRIRKMVTVGLWCIQTDPMSRPSMSRVIEMLLINY